MKIITDSAKLFNKKFLKSLRRGVYAMKNFRDRSPSGLGFQPDSEWRCEQRAVCDTFMFPPPYPYSNKGK